MPDLDGAIEGTFVTTIEGLSDDRSHPLQQAFAAENVPQCGYCMSGVLMAAAALLAHNPNPTDQQMDEAITNLCRCGTYPRIRRAIRRAAQAGHDDAALTAAPPPEIDPEDAAAAVPALTPVHK